MGRRVRTTADHGFLVGTGRDEEVLTRMAAEDLDGDCWLPLATGAVPGLEPAPSPVGGVIEDDGRRAGEGPGRGPRRRRSRRSPRARGQRGGRSAIGSEQARDGRHVAHALELLRSTSTSGAWPGSTWRRDISTRVRGQRALALALSPVARRASRRRGRGLLAAPRRAVHGSDVRDLPSGDRLVTHPRRVVDPGPGDRAQLPRAADPRPRLGAVT